MSFKNEEVYSVLLVDGWHLCQPKTFETEWETFYGSGEDQLINVFEFLECDRDGNKEWITGPLTSVLAVKIKELI